MHIGNKSVLIRFVHPKRNKNVFTFFSQPRLYAYYPPPYPTLPVLKFLQRMHAGVLRDIALEEKEKAEAAAILAVKVDTNVARGGETTVINKETSLPTATTISSGVTTNSALEVPAIVAIKGEKTTITAAATANVPSAKTNSIKTSSVKQQQQPVSMECEGDICRLSVKRTIPIQSLK